MPLHAQFPKVSLALTPQVFTTFTSRLAADALAFSRPADLDALDACAQQLAQVRGVQQQKGWLTTMPACSPPSTCSFCGACNAHPPPSSLCSVVWQQPAPLFMHPTPSPCRAGAGGLPGAARHQCRGAQGGRPTARPTTGRLPRAAGGWAGWLCLLWGAGKGMGKARLARGGLRKGVGAARRGGYQNQHCCQTGVPSRLMQTQHVLSNRSPACPPGSSSPRCWRPCSRRLTRRSRPASW